MLFSNAFIDGKSIVEYYLTNERARIIRPRYALFLDIRIIKRVRVGWKFFTSRRVIALCRQPDKRSLF